MVNQLDLTRPDGEGVIAKYRHPRFGPGWFFEQPAYLYRQAGHQGRQPKVRQAGHAPGEKAQGGGPARGLPVHVAAEAAQLGVTEGKIHGAVAGQPLPPGIGLTAEGACANSVIVPTA